MQHYYVMFVLANRVVATLLSIVFGSTSLRAMEPKELIEQWTAACDKVNSYDVVVHMQVFARQHANDELKYVGTETTRQRFLSGWWRVDEVDEGSSEAVDSSTGRRTIAWDGHYGRLLNSAENQGIIYPLAELHDTLTRVPHYHEFFRGPARGMTYAMCVGQRREITITTDKIAGAVVITASPDPTANVTFKRSAINVKFDTSKGELPVYISVSLPGLPDQLMFEFENTQFANLSPGFSVPVKGKKTTYGLEQGRNFVSSVVNYEIIQAQSALNPPLARDVFSFAFPVGTIVYDKESGENYIVQPDNEKDVEAYVEHVKQHVIGHEDSPRAARRVPWLLLLGLNIGLIAFLIALILYRMKARLTRD